MSSLLLFALLLSANGQDRDQFARETGLDADLVNLVQVDVGGTELTVVFVFINDRTFDSKISATLRATLLPYIGENALYVNPNIESIVSQFPFDPLAVSMEQSGDVHQPELGAWAEITSGFLDGRFEVNPAGTSQGSGSEGVIVLGDAIDADLPFDVVYAGARATFRIDANAVVATGFTTGGPSAATTSHDPIEVPYMEDVTTLEEVLALSDFTAESMATLLGLPEEDVRTTELTFVSGQVLRLLYVRLEEAIRASALGQDLVAALDPLIGTGAVMVWAFSQTGVSFSPWNFFVQQDLTNFVFFSSASFVELTPGFIGRIEIPAGGLMAGVIRLPRGVDPLERFKVFYSTPGARGETGVEFP